MATQALHDSTGRRSQGIAAPAAADVPQGKAPVADNDPTKTVTPAAKISAGALIFVTAVLLAFMLLALVLMFID